MIKDTLVYALFYLVIGTIHYFLLPHLPEIKPFNDFYIMYFCLFIVSLMGSTLFFLNNKLAASNFAGMFIIFTTIQLLACMSFALAIKMIRTEDAKTTLLHFVCAFFVTLIFQTIYLLKAHNNAAQDA
jgi:uncharacterized membrane protein YhaH (DUF805 family)